METHARTPAPSDREPLPDHLKDLFRDYLPDVDLDRARVHHTLPWIARFAPISVRAMALGRNIYFDGNFDPVLGRRHRHDRARARARLAVGSRGRVRAGTRQLCDPVRLGLRPQPAPRHEQVRGVQGHSVRTGRRALRTVDRGHPLRCPGRRLSGGEGGWPSPSSPCCRAGWFSNPSMMNRMAAEVNETFATWCGYGEGFANGFAFFALAVDAIPARG